MLIVIAGATGTRADFQHHGRSGLVGHRIDQLGDPTGDVLVHPVDDETVRREQAQRAAVLHGLQRPDPGIELLLRQFRLPIARDSGATTNPARFRPLIDRKKELFCARSTREAASLYRWTARLSTGWSRSEFYAPEGIVELDTEGGAAYPCRPSTRASMYLF